MSIQISAEDIGGAGPRNLQGLSGATLTSEASMTLPSAATSQKLPISTASAQSSAITTRTVLATTDVDCFARQGANPTAVNDGTDQILLAGNSYRLLVTPGNKIAFITLAGTGNVYITPGA